MKNKLVSLLVMLLISCSSTVVAQQANINVTVFEPLPEVSLMAFVTTKGLKNTPRILQIDITPHGKEVIVKGSVQWRKVDEASFYELVSFTTKPFTARNFYNDDISSIDGIELKESNYNDDLLQENLNKGKPTGTYKIVVEVYDTDESFLDSDERDIDFLNPAQTLSIVEPGIDDVLDIGGVIITWTDVTGVTDYFVKANKRSSKFESLEEALSKGNPLVDNKNVGVKRSVNLREILDRELLAGDEVVVQVRASVPGPGGPTIIYSNIVNFRIKGASSAVVDKGVKEFRSLVIQFLDEAIENGNKDAISQLNGNKDAISQLNDDKDAASQLNDDSDATTRLQELLDKMLSGELDFNNLSIRTANGRLLSYPEFQQLLEYLRNNPDVLLNILFEDK